MTSPWDSPQVEFVKSVFKTSRLPLPEFPEIAFAGRSNVGKSSLINRLINRRNLVKVSGRPGKTQSLNFFLVAGGLYLVDLPGYGYAKVPRKIQNDWQGLISSYLLKRETLRCVVVIIDLRHGVKPQDLELVTWLRNSGVPFLPVYTKLDKVKKNQQGKNAALLDAGLGVRAAERVLFSARTGAGKENLISALDQFLS